MAWTHRVFVPSPNGSRVLLHLPETADPQRFTTGRGEPDLTAADLDLRAEALRVESPARNGEEPGAAFVDEQEQRVAIPEQPVETLERSVDQDVEVGCARHAPGKLRQTCQLWRGDP